MCKSNLVEGLEVIGTATPPVAGAIGILRGKDFRRSFKFAHGCPSSSGE